MQDEIDDSPLDRFSIPTGKGLHDDPISLRLLRETPGNRSAEGRRSSIARTAAADRADARSIGRDRRPR